MREVWREALSAAYDSRSQYHALHPDVYTLVPPLAQEEGEQVLFRR
jgi:hypothetical protein